MPSLSWSAFVERRSRAHLIAAALVDEPGLSLHGDARALVGLLRRALRKLPAQGDYAATIARGTQGVEIVCAFERLADADRLADQVGAAPYADNAGWASARGFALDAAALQRLRDLAGPPQHKRRPPLA